MLYLWIMQYSCGLDYNALQWQQCRKKEAFYPWCLDSAQNPLAWGAHPGWMWFSYKCSWWKLWKNEVGKLIRGPSKTHQKAFSWPVAPLWSSHTILWRMQYIYRGRVSQTHRQREEHRLKSMLKYFNCLSTVKETQQQKKKKWVRKMKKFNELLWNVSSVNSSRCPVAFIPIEH